jgi:hypothetical protein
MIAISFTDGRPVALMHVVDKAASKDDIEAIIAKAGFGDNAGWREVNVDDIPTDRTFRNAWIDQGAKIDIEIQQARLVAHGIRRKMREAEMSPLDQQIIIKINDPADVASTEARRQVLRDKYAIMQVSIDGAQTADELIGALQG